MSDSSEDDKYPQTTETYDEMFSSGGHAGAFDLPYRHSPYYPLFREVYLEIRRLGVSSILEVGCGSGGLAHLLQDKMAIEYAGFDFSRIAVGKARQRTGREDLFYVADALLASSYPEKYDAVVCTEVLEHVEQDREVIANWRQGVPAVCSVPNFDSKYHVRFFSSQAEVMDRYSDLLDIERIHMVRKPALDDLSLRNRLLQLRWNRYRPGRLKELLGWGNPDKVGAWFVFTGSRR